jgi:hypothetical protein
LLEGLEWGTSEAVDKLKKMLWGLEALRVFDDRLSGSLSQIQKAYESMGRTVKQVCNSFTAIDLSDANEATRKLASSTSIYFKNTTTLSKSSKNDMGCSLMFKLGRN